MDEALGVRNFGSGSQTSHLVFTNLNDSSVLFSNKILVKDQTSVS